MARRRSAFFRFAVALPLLIGVVAGLLLVPIYREGVMATNERLEQGPDAPRLKPGAEGRRIGF